jgi:hypothetical protein
MPFSRSRNSITVFHDGDVWRATLGSDTHTGVSSTSGDPFTAIELTVGKAREQGWAFDATPAADHTEAADEPAAKPIVGPTEPTLAQAMSQTPTPGKATPASTPAAPAPPVPPSA